MQAGDVLRADVTLTVDADVPREALAGLADRFQVDVVVHCDDPRFATLVPHVRVRVRAADLADDDGSDGDYGERRDAGTDRRVDAVPGPVVSAGGGRFPMGADSPSWESTMTASPASDVSSDRPASDGAADEDGRTAAHARLVRMLLPGPRRAIVSLDSTSPQAERLFRESIIAVETMPGNQVEGVSPLYHVSGFDGPDGMAAVMQLSTRLEPRDLIAALQGVEASQGGEVDLDVVDYEGVTSDEPDCRLPWPSASRRAAVLAPWLDMDPDASLGGDPVAFLLAMAPDAGRVGMLSDNWIIGGTA